MKLTLTRHLNPIARKRLRRFVRRRRAYWSLWALGTITLVSLAADLICNEKPLLVRFEGRTYLPILRYYPASTFVPDGGAMRPDYKVINRRPAFRDNAANFMVFTPIPYGPRETIGEAALRELGDVNITFQPIPRAGSVDVDGALTVTRSVAAGAFFGLPETNLVGTALDAVWTVPEALREAIRLRFANTPTDRVSMPLRRRDTRLTADASLATFRERSRPPETVRLTFRETIDVDTSTTQVVFDHRGEVKGTPPPPWSRLTAAERDRLVQCVADCRTEAIDPLVLVIDGTEVQVRVQSTVSWPYPPVGNHIMGIDNAGRDVFARILHGLRISLIFGFLLVVCAMAIGTVAGAIQGYFGGWVDITGQRFTEIWHALPFLYVIILMGSIYGTRFGLLLFCYGIFNWIGISYYIRAEFLRLRKQPFVDAARATGISTRAVIFRHILPNALTPIITFLPFSLVGAIGSLAALDYLGFGLPALAPSLGELLQQAQKARWAWWLVVYPASALFLVMILAAFVGEGIREAYDPREPARLE